MSAPVSPDDPRRLSTISRSPAQPTTTPLNCKGNEVPITALLPTITAFARSSLVLGDVPVADASTDGASTVGLRSIHIINERLLPPVLAKFAQFLPNCGSEPEEQRLVPVDSQQVMLGTPTQTLTLERPHPVRQKVRDLARRLSLRSSARSVSIRTIQSLEAINQFTPSASSGASLAAHGPTSKPTFLNAREILEDVLPFPPRPDTSDSTSAGDSSEPSTEGFNSPATPATPTNAGGLAFAATTGVKTWTLPPVLVGTPPPVPNDVLRIAFPQLSLHEQQQPLQAVEASPDPFARTATWVYSDATDANPVRWTEQQFNELLSVETLPPLPSEAPLEVLRARTRIYNAAYNSGQLSPSSVPTMPTEPCVCPACLPVGATYDHDDAFEEHYTPSSAAASEHYDHEFVEHYTPSSAAGSEQYDRSFVEHYTPSSAAASERYDHPFAEHYTPSSAGVSMCEYPRLGLRGGGKLNPDDTIPATVWRAAGGGGQAPTVREYRDWRNSGKQGVYRKKSSDGDKKPGFWRRLCGRKPKDDE